MLRNYEELLELLDPDCKLFKGFDREQKQITKKLEGFYEYLLGLSTTAFRKPNILSNEEICQQFAAGFGKTKENFCDICLVPLNEEKMGEAQDKKGHIRCLNYWLNKVV